jgi:hypothetical protein
MSKSASAAPCALSQLHYRACSFRSYILRMDFIYFLREGESLGGAAAAAAAASLSAAINNQRTQQHAPWGKSKFDISNE